MEFSSHTTTRFFLQEEKTFATCLTRNLNKLPVVRHHVYSRQATLEAAAGRPLGGFLVKVVQGYRPVSVAVRKQFVQL